MFGRPIFLRNITKRSLSAEVSRASLKAIRRNVGWADTKWGSYMYFVYILKSINHINQIYIGFTANLEERLITHNAARVVATRKYIPWEVVTYVVFKNKEQAIELEKYLKSGSGRSFMHRRLI